VAYICADVAEIENTCRLDISATTRPSLLCTLLCSALGCDGYVPVRPSENKRSASRSAGPRLAWAELGTAGSFLTGLRYKKQGLAGTWASLAREVRLALNFGQKDTS